MLRIKLVPIIVLSFILLISGCVGKKASKPDSGKSSNSKANFVELDFPSSRYLTATGSGDSEFEAKRNAKSEISNIFEAKISSDLTSNTTAIVDTKAGDSMKKIVKQNINVQSNVQLKGLIIGKTWKEGGTYYAVAVLEKSKAKDEWLKDIEKLDNKIDAQLKVIGEQKSKVTKLKPLKTVLNIWMEKQALMSRLRVIGYNAPTADKHDVKSIFEQIATIKSSINIYVQIQGFRAAEVKEILSKYLTDADFKFTGMSNSADLLIQGKSLAERVRNNNRDFVFARAKLFLSLIDLKTGVKIGEIAEDTRKGALNIEEAAHKAVKAVTKKTSAKVIDYFN